MEGEGGEGGKSGYARGRNASILSFRVIHEFDSTGIIKRERGEGKRIIFVGEGISRGILVEKSKTFLLPLSPPSCCLHSSIVTSHSCIPPRGRGESTLVEGARLAKSFSLSRFRSRPEQQREETRDVRRNFHPPLFLPCPLQKKNPFPRRGSNPSRG